MEPLASEDKSGTSYLGARVVTKIRKRRAKPVLGTNTTRVIRILAWSCDCEECKAGETVAVPRGLGGRYPAHFKKM